MSNDFSPKDSEYLASTLQKTLERLIDEGHDPAEVRKQAPELASQMKTAFTERRTQLQGNVDRGQKRIAGLEAEEGPSLGGEIAGGFNKVGGEVLKHGNAFAAGALDWGTAGLARHIPGVGQRLESDQQQSPVASAIGKGLGGAAGLVVGPAALAAKAGTAAVSRVAPGLASTAMGRMGAGTASGAVSGAGMGAVDAAMGGEDAGGIAKRALTDGAIGALAGGGTAALGEGAGAVRRAFRSDRSALGGNADTLKALDAMEGEGRTATVGPLRRVKDPELAALPVGKKGYVEAAKNARNTITESGQTELRTARANYGREIDEIAEAAGDAAVDQSALQARLQTLRQENQVNGVSVDDKLDGALAKVGKMLTKKTGLVGADGADVSVDAASFREVLKTKKAVEKMAEFGMPVTAENRPYREVYRALAEEAEAIDPTRRLGQLNKRYAKTMEKLESANDVLYGKEAPEVAGRAAARRQATNKLMRVGDDTTAGTVNDEFLEELGNLDPEYRKAIEGVMRKKAIEGTRFGLPQISKSPEKWATGLLEQNLTAAQARVVDPALGAVDGAGKYPAHISAALAARKQEKDRAAKVKQARGLP